jgi:peptidyl-tRNA hydrolase, PTH1 family
MKYLVVGLGNIGDEYEETRHNVGFKVVDYLAEQEGKDFKLDKQAYVCELKLKGRTVNLIKPSTYMNKSGKAVQHWATALKVAPENILVIVDDMNLDFGKLFLSHKGSDGGHNGIKDINQCIGSNYGRLRFGLGRKYHKGQHVDFVLGEWDEEDRKHLPMLLKKSAEAVKSYCSIGLKFTAEKYNKSFLTE